MKSKYLIIGVAQLLTTALYAEVSLGEMSDICPAEITMDQLKNVNEHGSITVGGHVLSGIDRAHIASITPKAYHPSSLTALAHLRGSSTRDGKLHCNYGYKTTFGNLGSKLSENVLGTSRTNLNEKYDYNFTLEFDLSTHTPPLKSPLDTKEPPELSHQESTHAPVELKTHPEVAPSAPATTHEETVVAPVEHPASPEVAHQSTVDSNPVTIVITKKEMDEDLTLKDHLSTLGLVDNPKISEFIVDRRYQFIENDADAKKVTTSPVDMVKMKQAYDYVKEWFEKKHQNR